MCDKRLQHITEVQKRFDFRLHPTPKLWFMEANYREFGCERKSNVCIRLTSNEY